MFFIAYTKNGVDDLEQAADHVCVQRRAGLVERLAAPGHARAEAGEDSGRCVAVPPPYELSSNPYSLLDITDLCSSTR